MAFSIASAVFPKLGEFGFFIHFSMFFHQYLYFFLSFLKIFTRWSRGGAKFLRIDF